VTDIPGVVRQENPHIPSKEVCSGCASPCRNKGLWADQQAWFWTVAHGSSTGLTARLQRLICNSLILNEIDWNCRLQSFDLQSLDTFTHCEGIVTRKHLRLAMESYPDAANEIKAWTAIVEAVRWHNFDDVRGTFKDADSVEGFVIFNIRHNRYRLITVIHYAKTTKERQTQGHVYIRSFLTHKEYDNRSNWDRRYGKQ
jgi:mRNA interferase HigB